ncbi:MAG: C10 family peptidase, partial [Candidatus Cloacimonetes bacterium]|nr:C10 family peptidase [Candidatus Cloacimonadota bacterium]
MKKLSLLFAALIVLSQLFSAPVPQATVLQVASNWLELQTGQQCSANNWAVYPNAQNPLYWKINFNPGFVVVSADDSCIPILGFCTNGNYSVGVPFNEAAEELLLEYSLQIEDAKNNNRSNTETLPIWDAILNQTICISEAYDVGLETPQWGGQYPYNMYCPFDNHNSYDNNEKKRSAVGCVATAAAQIMNYHKQWNYVLNDEDKYTSDYHGFVCHVDVDSLVHDFPGFHALNGYLDEVNRKWDNDIELDANDKTALSFASGILVEMQYSSRESGALSGWNVYNKNNMYCESAYAYQYTCEAWLDLIKNQLLLNRPIHYSGRINTGGHAYIIWGFQSTNMSTTLNLVNWGRAWCYPEYWSLQPLNPASPYPDYHSMLFGIAPNVSVQQTILLENGSTDYSGISVSAVGHDGISKTFTSNNAEFEFRLPPGKYDFTITDSDHCFFSFEINNVIIQTGTSHISADPIVLTLKPNVVVVPTLDVPTIQEGIDLVRNGGTVVILNGHYTVSGLSWKDKHIKLQGQSQNGVILTNDPNCGLPAITLSGHGINNQDIISQITFSNCELIGTGIYRRGAAIELITAATPTIINCTFDHNRVGNSATSSFPYWYGTGGAVCIGGNSGTHNNTTRLINCTFANNYTLNGNGGGALVIYGQAQITGCEFTNNETIVTDGIENPVSRDMGGAVLIYTRLNQTDIDIEFDNCLFSNNTGRKEADDVFVANIEKLNTLRFNGCTFLADTPYSNEAKPAIKFLTAAENYLNNMNAALIITDNKFLSSRLGAVWFCDYYGKNRFTFTGNVVANNMYGGYGVYSWYPDGTPPENTDYLVFNNNTFSNIQGSGLILFQCPVTRLTNNVFENCSDYGIRWGDYLDNNPDWQTRGLIVSHCLFSALGTRYDFAGSTAHPLTEDTVFEVQTMHLDNYFRPIWNSDIVSVCIDAGIGDDDADGTPPDIGAIPAIPHKHWEYVFDDSYDKERWHWVSYPILNTITDGALIASEFFQELLLIHQGPSYDWRPTYLEEIQWMVEGNEESIYWNNVITDWNELVANHSVSSPQGYKIRLQQRTYPDFPYPVVLKESGFQTPVKTEFPIYGGVENWLGYFHEEARMPWDAFADIWDDISLIKAKDWSLIRMPGNGNIWGMQGKVMPLQNGDMVIVRTNQDHSFKWGVSHPVPPRTKSAPEQFVFDEKADYIPIYINIADEIRLGLKEIGLMVNGVCKGAVVVEDSLEQISAYVANASELSEGDIEFVFYYEESKSAGAQMRKVNVPTGKLNAKYGVAGSTYPYFEVDLDDNALENVVPLEFTLKQNYPNPFNPST